MLRRVATDATVREGQAARIWADDSDAPFATEFGIPYADGLFGSGSRFWEASLGAYPMLRVIARALRDVM
ncbi:hypothetical protein [Rugosimonospora africana]|uniref:hypothetical protein n=1 Tax=Rugosimonospora africana TaxID=556532 RepID=UPI0019446A9E|nr:hypothetical protein [Rugosimonospora africana]